jgi:hypothetical protein
MCSLPDRHIKVAWSSLEGPAMNEQINIVELAHEIAAIAGTTTDPETGRLLTELVGRLLEAAGLPPEDGEGGGELPSHWNSAPVDAYA